MRITLFKKGLDIMSQFCTAENQYADDFRLPGGVKVKPEKVIGSWRLVKDVYQDKYFDDPNRSFYSINREEECRTDYLTLDSLEYYEHWSYGESESVKLVDQGKYSIDQDSLIIYHKKYSNSYAYEMRGDTLVLISTPYGHCYGVDYEYYLRVQDSSLLGRLDAGKEI